MKYMLPNDRKIECPTVSKSQNKKNTHCLVKIISSVRSGNPFLETCSYNCIESDLAYLAGTFIFLNIFYDIHSCSIPVEDTHFLSIHFNSISISTHFGLVYSS